MNNILKGKTTNLPYIKKYSPKNIYGEVIGKICSSHYYANKDELVENIADDLSKNEKIPSIAIVDDSDKPIGMISRRDLFDVLGRKYGRDIFMYKKIGTLAREVKIFRNGRNIFSIANEINGILYDQTISHFILIDSSDKFAGIFSTVDILVYLSMITKNEIELATKLQNNIIKKEKIISEKKFSATGYSRMAKGIGGDYYSIIKYEENKWIMSVCDVTGKGISSALVSTLIGGMFHMFDLKNGLEDFILRINDYIRDTFNLEKYLTAVFMDLDAESGLLKIYDMGHSYFYLYRKNKLYKISLKKNVPVGIRKNIKIKGNTLRLQEDDRVFVFTDGLTDQRNSSGEFFDFNKIKKIITNNKSLQIEQLKDMIICELDEFRDNYPQFDDITLILFEYK